MANIHEVYAPSATRQCTCRVHRKLNFRFLPDPHESHGSQRPRLFSGLADPGAAAAIFPGRYRLQRGGGEPAKPQASRSIRVEALARFGVLADAIGDVVVTHLHYDQLPAAILEPVFPQRYAISSSCRTAR